MERFKAKIYKVDINPCVDVPKRVIDALLREAGKTAGPVRVQGKLNGAKFQTTVVKFRGKWRLYLNAEIRSRSGRETGDQVTIELELDPEPPEYPMPKELAKALEQDAKAKRSFEELTASRQKEIIRYLGSLKTEEALRRNIRKLIDEIL